MARYDWENDPSLPLARIFEASTEREIECFWVDEEREQYCVALRSPGGHLRWNPRWEAWDRETRKGRVRIYWDVLPNVLSPPPSVPCERLPSPPLPRLSKRAMWGTEKC